MTGAVGAATIRPCNFASCCRAPVIRPPETSVDPGQGGDKSYRQFACSKYNITSPSALAFKPEITAAFSASPSAKPGVLKVCQAEFDRLITDG